VGDYELHGLVNCPLFGENGFGGCARRMRIDANYEFG